VAHFDVSNIVHLAHRKSNPLLNFTWPYRQAVLQLASILDVPLRYPVAPGASRSYICDLQQVLSARGSGGGGGGGGGVGGRGLHSSTFQLTLSCFCQ